MKKFVFTLQALLHLKESLEKQERNNLAGIARRLNALNAEKDDMLCRRESASQDYAAKLAGGMMASETQRFTSYFRMMKELLEEQDKKIDAVQAEIEACRQRLVEAMREIHMFENLKDKQYQQYLQDAQIEEEKTIGDYVSFQTTHKPAG
jgi:flagellar protein FliJ